MLRDVDSAKEIVVASRRLLKAANVDDRLPTPVEGIVSAAGLVPSDELPFDESVLRRAPAELAAKVRQLGLRHKIHAMLDRRERKVYINPDIQHDARRRFRALHEVGHDILPSQRDRAYADNQFTVSWLTRVRDERDANQAGAELLFQLDLFRMIAAEYRVEWRRWSSLPTGSGPPTTPRCAGMRRRTMGWSERSCSSTPRAHPSP